MNPKTKNIGLSTLFLCSSLFFGCGLANADQWVRITIEKDGVYSISYDELRNMGFRNPENVGIAGRGAVQLPISSEEFSLKDSSVPVIHQNNRIFFYGEGPENYSFVADNSAPNNGYFINNGKNVYSDYGYYYLTDANGIKKDMPASSANSASSQLSWGVAKVYHEEDLYHNTTDTGNLFWGEKFNGGEPSSRTWNINISDAINSSQGSLHVIFYTEKGALGNFTFSTKDDKTTVDNISSPASNFTSLPISVQTLKLNKGNESITIDYSSTDNLKGVANLDNWVLSYRADFSGIFGSGGQIFALPAISSGSVASIPISSNSIVGLDITNTSDIKKLATNSSNSALVAERKDDIPMLALFDSSKDQLKIQSWEKLSYDPTSNPLHAQASQGADFLIITSDAYLPFAEALAGIHADYDGISTIVATIDDIYKEFSGGLPDPESYRKFINLISTKGKTQLKNVLLVGPITNDIRTKQKTLGYAQAHIMPQAVAVHNERGAYGVIDYFVSLDPSPNLSKIEKEHLYAGVGMLPFLNTAEAERYLRKLRNFLDNQGLLSNLNEWLFVGGLEDEHTHDQQCVDLASKIEKVSDNSVMVSVLAIDAYGVADAKKKLFQELNEGKGLTLYFGHSGNSMFGHKPNFFTTEEIHALSNSHLTFLITAGCSSTDTDQGKRGLGEDFILNSDAGAIAGIISMRETWSGQNYNYVEEFLSGLVSPYTGTQPTIGEYYMAAKNLQDNVNDLALLIIGDPALRLPMPIAGRVELSPDNKAVPGETLKIKGEIVKNSGEPDKSYNGFISIKLAEPPVVLRSADYETSGTNGEAVLDVRYSDNVVSVIETEVIAGKFDTQIPVPFSLSSFEGQKARLFASVLDLDGRQSGAGSSTVVIETAFGATTDSQNDKLPPVIEGIWTDENARTLYVSVSDDKGLNLSSRSIPSSLEVTIDAYPSSFVSLVPVSISDGGKRALLRAALPVLSDGRHSAYVSVADLAGNTTEGSLVFEAGSPFENITLSMKEKAAYGDCTFSVDGASSGASLMIYDKKGQLVSTISLKGSEAKWDCTDSQGNKVPSGLYKAVVVETSSSRSKHYSKSVYVPVI